MKSLTLGAVLVLFSNLALTIPVPDTSEAVVFGKRGIDLDTTSASMLEKRASWVFRPSTSTGCVGGVNYSGQQGVCVGVHGSSIVASGSCGISTWSGGNCQGSSHVVTPGCNNVNFASVKVVC